MFDLIQEIIRSVKYIYSTTSEPIPGIRIVTVSLEDSENLEMVANLSLYINVIILNNNLPVIQISNNVLSFIEGQK